MLSTLRPFEPSDLDAVIDLALRAWCPVDASMARLLGKQVGQRVYPDWVASQSATVRCACTDPDILSTVATASTQILGFGTVVVRSSESVGEIDLIAVDPVAQQRGVGGALVEHALAQMRDAGCTLAEVATGGDVGHAPARRLYEQMGFTPLPLVRYYRLLPRPPAA